MIAKDVQQHLNIYLYFRRNGGEFKLAKTGVSSRRPADKQTCLYNRTQERSIDRVDIAEADKRKISHKKRRPYLLALSLVLLIAVAIGLGPASRTLCFALRYGGRWSKKCDECDCGKIDVQNRNMRGASMIHAFLFRANLVSVDFAGANLNSSYMYSTYLKGCSFSATNMEGAVLAHSMLSGCTFHNCKLTNADLDGSEFLNCDFRQADLSGAHFENCAYNDSTRWPTGYNPEAHGAVKAAMVEGGPWDNSVLRP